MIKQLLAISIVFSSLFAGVCTSNIAHGHAVVESPNHNHAVECENCQTVTEQEQNCCDEHLENKNLGAIIKPADTKKSKNHIARTFSPKFETVLPKYKETYNYKSDNSKAPPNLQLILPRIE